MNAVDVLSMRASTARARAYAAFAATTLIWGSTFLAIRIGNDTVPPEWAATQRLGLAAVILSLVTLLTGQSFPRGKALATALRYGTLQLGLNFALVYWAETTAPSSLASVLFATVPLWGALIARLYGLERLHRGRLMGAAIAFGGIALIFMERRQPGAMMPALALVLATIAACVGSIELKRGPRQAVVPANAIGCGAGALVCFIASMLLREPHARPATWTAAGPIVYLAVVGSVGGFVLFSWLLGQWDTSRVWFVSLLAPIVGVTLGSAVRHEQLGPSALAGSLIVLAGVAIGLRSDAGRVDRRHPVRR